MNRFKYTGKISRFLLAGLLLGGLTLTSCSKNDNDIFEDDPVIRIDKKKSEIQSKLIDSENGWIVNFSPDGRESMGEFTMWLDFKKDWSVEIKTDRVLTDVGVEKSQYNFVLLSSVALNFPYGNKVHDFTAMDGQNLRTDIEFVFSKYVDDNTIEFIGHMTKQKVYFKKATAEEKKFQFTKRWDLVKKLEAVSKASLTMNGRTTQLEYTKLWKDNNFRAGMIKNGGFLLYQATDDGKTVGLLNPFEVNDNDVITELTLQGNSFVGKSTTGAILTLN
ncbi:MAG: DUF4302 domain-containing protein [Flavobacteriaceae bacterium]|jgi:hypothetical protein|nr:DUF4302 domain-containing protein [Flavobacteriaceae bacterium]